MAAPGLTAGTPGTTATAGTSHVVDLPAGTSPKLVIIEGSGAAHTLSATDWSVVKTLDLASDRILRVLTPDSGSSAATSLTVTSSASVTAAFVGFSTDGDVANAVISTGVENGTPAMDPDAVTVASGDYRVIAYFGYSDGRRAVGTYPTNYADTQANPRVSANNNAALGVASRALTGITSEDPDAFALAAGSPGFNGAATIAIPEETASEFTGTVAVAQDAQTSDVSGTVSGSPITGTVAVTQTDQTSAVSGTVTVPNPGGLPDAAVIAFYDAREVSGSATDPVASWTDSGPNSQDPLAQGTSGFRPTISDSGFGSVRSVEFDGVDDRLDVALDQTYSDDFALVVAVEILTFPAISLAAGVVYSTGDIPNKNILSIDYSMGRNGWTVMSADGDQDDHHTATSDYDYMADTPSRFVMTQLVRDAGELRLWENGTLIHDLDLSADAPLNNMLGLKVGMRENDSRPAHIRVGAVLLVDMAETDQATLLAAQDELMSDFNVTPFGDERSGTASPTQEDQTSAISGTVTVPEFTGTVAVTQEVQTSTASGTTTVPEFTGTVAAGQADQTSDASGEVVSAGFSGSVAATQDSQVAAAEGTVTSPAVTGTVAVVQDNQTSTATGEVVSAGFVGNLGVTQDNQVSEATGVFTPAPVTGSTDATQADQTSTISGTVTNPAFTGTVGVTQEAQTGVATGTTAVPAFTGTVNVTQDDQVGKARSPGLRLRLEGRSVSGRGAEGAPSGVGLEGTRL